MVSCQNRCFEPSSTQWRQGHICKGGAVNVGQKRGLGAAQPGFKAATADKGAIAAACCKGIDLGADAMRINARRPKSAKEVRRMDHPLNRYL